jgi:hypothetical protein
MVASNDENKGVSQVVGKLTSKGQEVWRVASDGKIKSITTRSSSTAAMDEAVIIYSDALKRLANR